MFMWRGPKPSSGSPRYFPRSYLEFPKDGVQVMIRKGKLSRSWLVAFTGAVLAATMTLGATFGTVVPIGGEAADIALDEARGVLYIANFTANRIDVMSLANNTDRKSVV